MNETDSDKRTGFTLTVLMENNALDDLASEHGVSFWIETPGGNILFDTGASGAFAENAERLGVDLAKTDLIVLSHGHYDHVGGLKTALEICSAPVLAGPQATHAKLTPSGDGFRDIGMDREVAASLGDRLRTIDSRIQILPGVEILPAAPIESPVPTDNGRLLRKQGETTTPDPFEEELSLLIQGRKGPVLVTGCSHRGIANIHRSAGVEVGAIVGGLHLLHESEQTIRAVAHEISDARDLWIGHCTGDPGLLLIEEELPGRLHGIPAGTRASF